LTRLMEDIDYNLNLFRHIFPWATEKAKERYRELQRLRC
jgi:hypothetical protein